MKTHISLPTTRLDTSVAFYRALFEAEPVKQRSDYALFIVEEPPLELALEAAPHVAMTRSGEHFGIAVDDEVVVDNAIERLSRAGLQTRIEREVGCCYAIQTKVWATDPDGRQWEVYHVSEETEERNADAGTTASNAQDCCATTSEDAQDCCATTADARS